MRFRRLVPFDADDKTVAAIIQDRQSFIWIGALNGGLYRYDGYRSVKYSHDPQRQNSLPSDRVSIVYEDKKGRIWVGTFEGLARYNPATDDFTRFPIGTVTGVPRIVRNIISDGKDGLWLGTWAGLQHFNPDKGDFTHYRHSDDDPDSPGAGGVDALALDAQGGLWLDTWPKGLDYLAPGSKVFRHYRVDSDAAPDSLNGAVHSLQMDRQQRLWIGTAGGVYRWQSGSDWNTRVRVASPESRVGRLFLDGEGSIWAATWTAGLLRWKAGSDEPTHFTRQSDDPHSLHTTDIASVMRDRANNLWVGTFNAGISVANLGSTGFTRFILPAGSAPQPQPHNSIMAVAPAPGGRLWLGGLTGLALCDPVKGDILRSYRAHPGQPGAMVVDRIDSLYQQPGGPLWVGSSAGLLRLDRPDAAFAITHFGSGQADIIGAIAPGSNGMLWIGTGADVHHFDPRTGRYRTYAIEKGNPNSRRVAGTSTLLEDKLGRVWMASQWRRGLEMLDLRSGRMHFFERGMSDESVSSLHQDSQGRLWAGTAKGLDEIITAPDGAISFRAHTAHTGGERVFAIQSAPDGTLWLSTEAALIRYHPDRASATTYTALDGLIDNFRVGAAFTAPDGRFYFAGASGVSIVRPEQVRIETVAPQVAITDVSVFNRSLAGTVRPPGVKLEGAAHAPRALELPPGQSVVSIEFAALHFTNPGQNHYAYRLDGFDRDWVQADAHHRSATYTNLAPGNYVFAVKGSNDRGQWSEQPARLALTIVPAYWQTWWFRLLAVALASALLLGGFFARVNSLKRVQRRLALLVAERTGALEESNAKLAALSNTDGLTGITNRRGFDTALAEAWALAARTGAPLALAMLDVDHFKRYNDTYGHQDGDACLQAVAQALAAQYRRTGDVVARYGGEEFALLLQLSNAEHALRLAEETCASIAALRLPHAGSSYGLVTVSIGVAALVPQPGDTAQRLLREADAALYRSKQAGRNRASMAANVHLQEPGMTV